ncbi:MAG: metal ABC transporter ATP-binding protein [Oscillospiraceae bacterium]|nr:metal ABC transporter ATP-binding protein [Oscillospiraceae bacterium]
MPQITCQDLTLGYEGKPIVTNLTFEVNAGDYLCIIGENGSGKSTLVKAMLNLISPLSGQIITGDGLTPNDIGYLPQQKDIQRDFPATVREVVRSGCLGRSGMRPFYAKEEKQLAENAMEKLGISKIAKSCYRELSGGQQQRVMLARALCAARKLLLLDEPAAGLDPKAAADLYNIIDALNAGSTTIIMVSHDVEAAKSRASHILDLGSQVSGGQSSLKPEFYKTGAP